MLKGNLAGDLDYFVRNSELNSVVMLLIAPGSGKEMLEKTKDLELNEAIRLQKVFVYKESSLNGLMMPIEKFLNDSLTISASSTASGILISNEGEEVLGKNTDETIKKQQGQQGMAEEQNDQSGGGSQSDQSSGENLSSGGDTSSSGQGGQSSGSGQASRGKGGQSSGGGQGSSQTASTQNGRIKYYNDVYYFKNGKYVNKFDKEEEILGYFLSNRAPNTGEIVAENISGDYLKDATIAFKFRKQDTNQSIEFCDGKPVLKFDISFTDMKINEILNGGDLTPAIYEFQAESSNTNIKKAIQNRVETCVRSAFEKAKQDGVDIFKIADLSWKYKPKEWKSIMQTKVRLTLKMLK